MNIMQSSKFERIYCVLKDEKTEAFWAVPVCNDLYELRNIPFKAFDLHFGDIVRAIPDGSDEKPRIREVVRRSGHKTLRIIFQVKDNSTKQKILEELKSMYTHYENANSTLFALDVEPEADYLAVCNFLWDLEQKGILVYETGTMTDNNDPS